MNLQAANLLRWILVETSHAGNVGSAARAMKTMGFNDLHLIKPKTSGIHKEAEAIALASGATDLLESAVEHQSLDQAIGGYPLVLGLTSRDREFGPPAIDWQSALALICQNTQNHGKTALVFGPERTGLENHHLSFCTHRVWLDANPDYPSLNLAQALMVCAYTLRQALQDPNLDVISKNQAADMDLADPAAVTAMLEHWRKGLEAIAYLDPANPKKLMPRLEALFARSRLRKEEIDLLRGIAKQMLLRK